MNWSAKGSCGATSPHPGWLANLRFASLTPRMMPRMIGAYASTTNVILMTFSPKVKGSSSSLSSTSRSPSSLESVSRISSKCLRGCVMESPLSGVLCGARAAVGINRSVFVSPLSLAHPRICVHLVVEASLQIPGYRFGKSFDDMRFVGCEYGKNALDSLR